MQTSISEIAATRKHIYTQTGRVDGGKWEVKVSPGTGYGYYEHDTQGEGGGLWFNGKELVDFDGRSFLPAEVADALIALGYTVEKATFCL